MMGLFDLPDCGIDLGTANTLICDPNRGVVVNEPSVVTVSGRDGSVESAGAEAHRTLGRNPGRVEPAQPIQRGVVTDPKLAEELLRRLLKQLGSRSMATLRRAAIALPTGITDVERFAIIECVRHAGARRVAIIEQLLAAAYGCGLSLSEPRGFMLVDVGAGLTEAGVFSLGEVVAAASSPCAGDSIDQAIADYVRSSRRLLIGLPTAAAVKHAVGSALPHGDCGNTTVVRGRCLVHGLPRVLSLCGGEVREAIAPAVAQIVHVAKSTLERVPPELSADLIETGAVLTGGTALLPGLADRLAREMQIPVKVGPAPLQSVANGLAGVIGLPSWWRRARYPD